MTDNQQDNRNQQRDPADFLHAMAQDQGQSPPALPDDNAPIALDDGNERIREDQQEEIGDEERAFMATGDGSDDAPPALGELGRGAPQDPAARKARAANIARATQKVHAKQFKQTMIPLLIAAAALLLIMATWVYTKLPPEDVALANPDGSLLNRPWARMAVLVAYPLAGLLLLGAFLFYRDLQREKD